MSDVYIVEACRSAIGKRGKGLAGLKPAILGLVQKAALNRAKLHLKILIKLSADAFLKWESKLLTLQESRGFSRIAARGPLHYRRCPMRIESTGDLYGSDDGCFRHRGYCDELWRRDDV